MLSINIFGDVHIFDALMQLNLLSQYPLFIISGLLIGMVIFNRALLKQNYHKTYAIITPFLQQHTFNRNIITSSNWQQ